MTPKRSSKDGMDKDSFRLRKRLKSVGLSDLAIDAAWPTWWSDDAEASTSARAELRFSLARKLGLDPSSLLEDEEPSFVWKDGARFKHLSGESATERAAITSFGRVLGSVLVNATSIEPRVIANNALSLRKLLMRTRPYVDLVDLLLLCWSAGIPVIHLRIFPWPQKRMAAMTVRVADRYAILLGKDSMYPAHVAFYLAHELGHIARGHLESDKVIVDFESERPGLDTNDNEEISADSFALELLTGMASPIVLPSTERYTARSLARTVLRASQELGIEPGTLALCLAYSTNDWRTSNAAMKYIYRASSIVWQEVNRFARRQLTGGQVPDDTADYLSAVLGEASNQ